MICLVMIVVCCLKMARGVVIPDAQNLPVVQRERQANADDLEGDLPMGMIADGDNPLHIANDPVFIGRARAPVAVPALNEIEVVDVQTPPASPVRRHTVAPVAPVARPVGPQPVEPEAYICAICHAEKRTANGLTQHYQRNHPRALRCDVAGCLAAFTGTARRRSLTEHKVAKHENKRAKCNACGQKWMYKNGYYHHLKMQRKANRPVCPGTFSMVDADEDVDVVDAAIVDPAPVDHAADDIDDDGVVVDTQSPMVVIIPSESQNVVPPIIPVVGPLVRRVIPPNRRISILSDEVVRPATSVVRPTTSNVRSSTITQPLVGAHGDDVAIVGQGPVRSSVIRFASFTGAVMPQLLREGDIDDVILVPSSPSSQGDEDPFIASQESASGYQQLVAETVADEDDAMQTPGDDSVMKSGDPSVEMLLQVERDMSLDLERVRAVRRSMGLSSPDGDTHADLRTPLTMPPTPGKDMQTPVIPAVGDVVNVPLYRGKFVIIGR